MWFEYGRRLTLVTVVVEQKRGVGRQVLWWRGRLRGRKERLEMNDKEEMRDPILGTRDSAAAKVAKSIEATAAPVKGRLRSAEYNG